MELLLDVIYILELEWKESMLILLNFMNRKNLLPFLIQFLKDFFVTKLNNSFQQKYLYHYFINYFETMLQYMSEDDLIAKFKTSAALYNDIMNVNLSNESYKPILNNNYIYLAPKLIDLKGMKIIRYCILSYEIKNKRIEPLHHLAKAKISPTNSYIEIDESELNKVKKADG